MTLKGIVNTESIFSKFYLRGKLVFRVQLKPVCYFRGIEHFCPYEVNIIQSRVLFRVKARVEIRKSNEGTNGKTRKIGQINDNQAINNLVLLIKI